MTNDAEPVFDPKGRYLYFLSNRDFNLTFSGFGVQLPLHGPDARLRRPARGGRAGAVPARRATRRESRPASARCTPPPNSGANARAVAGRKAESAARLKQPPRNSTAATPIDPAAARLRNGAMTVTLNRRASPSRLTSRTSRIACAPSPARPVTTAPVRDGRRRALPGGPGSLALYNIDDARRETVLEGIQDYDLSGDARSIIFQRATTTASRRSSRGRSRTPGCSSSKA